MTRRIVVAPTKADTLTDENRAKDLDTVNLIKEKQDGTIKVIMCANGIKQMIFKEVDSVASLKGVA